MMIRTFNFKPQERALNGGLWLCDFGTTEYTETKVNFVLECREARVLF